MEKKKRILFVDDEPNVLQGLRRMLRAMRNEWEMAFVTSGQEALETMEKESFDVVVTDMRMPGMDGASLLREIKRRSPNVVRFVLSGQSDQETIFRSVGPTHQFLAKPCDSDTLKATVERAFALRELLSNDGIKSLVSQIDQLPCIPELYKKVMDELQQQDPSLNMIGDIIEKDVGMTAKILQLVNSAFFGIRQNISSPVQAVSLLGLETIRGLVLMVGVFSEASKEKLPNAFSPDAIGKHCLAVSTTARAIVKCEKGDKRLADEAFTAGLLHDTGKLVLAKHSPEKYGEVLKLVIDEGRNLVELEKEVFGATHAEIGGYLLGLWGLPDPIVEAIGFHHTPSLCVAREFSPLSAVHVSNALEKGRTNSEEEGQEEEVDTGYLKELGLEDRLSAWQETVFSLVSEREEE